MSKDKKLINITRFDIVKAGRTDQRGWWVRLQRGGEKFHNFFNDTKYGGKEEGLKAAIMFRDIVKDKVTNNKNIKRKPRSNSGVSGVSRIDSPYKSHGYNYHRKAWIANWINEKGKPASTSFSIDKHGEEEAFRLALEARDKGLQYQREKAPVVFRAPKNIKQKIWRYLDFTKLISLLETESLYFSSIDDLNDPFEGSFSKVNEALRPLIHKSQELTPEMISKKIKELRKQVFVNCWHMNDYESAAMWEIYSKSNESVCVQSTFELFQSEMVGKADVGVIQYVNYEEDYIPEYDPYLAFLYKRKSFKHEQEIRGLLKNDVTPSGGINIPVNIQSLIQKIYISPSAPTWLLDLVKDVMKRYGHNFEVAQSSLSDEPFF